MCSCEPVITLEFLNFNHQIFTTQHGDLRVSSLDGVGALEACCRMQLQWVAYVVLGAPDGSTFLLFSSEAYALVTGVMACSSQQDSTFFICSYLITYQY